MSLIPRLLKILESYLQNPEVSAKAERFTSTEDPPRSHDTEWDASSPYDSPELQAVHDDLALFDLTLPTTLAAVTQQRNTLLRAYHPDKFQAHPEKQQTANEMIQLINSAYERLATYFKTTQ